MPMPSKGNRIAITIRLPYDEYYEVAKRARQRDWSLSQYISWCVAREIGSRRVGRRRKGTNTMSSIDLIRQQAGADESAC